MGYVEALIGFVAAYVAYQLWVSVQVLRAAQYERHQRWLQLGLIWFIPLFGAIFVQSMLWSDGRAPYKPEPGYTEPRDNAS